MNNMNVHTSVNDQLRSAIARKLGLNDNAECFWDINANDVNDFPFVVRGEEDSIPNSRSDKFYSVNYVNHKVKEICTSSELSESDKKILLTLRGVVIHVPYGWSSHEEFTI